MLSILGGTVAHGFGFQWERARTGRRRGDMQELRDKTHEPAV